MIRKITPEDKQVFLTMAEDFYHSEAVCYRIPSQYHENTFNEMMRSDVYLQGFIFEEDSKIAGYALINKTFSQEAGGIVVWLEDLMILPEFRSQGLGSKFFRYLEKNIPAARYRLETEPDNEDAARLYKRLGYEFCPYVQWVKKTEQNKEKSSC